MRRRFDHITCEPFIPDDGQQTLINKIFSESDGELFPLAIDFSVT